MEKCLTQLQAVETKEQSDSLDMLYLGPHEALDRFLIEFSKGEVVKSSFEPRKRYNGHKVLDMSKIRMDFFRNEITDLSFIVTD